MRDRANLRISRDRANIDLEMLSHQVQKVQTQAAGSSASSKSRLPSLPPGPPSSAASGSNIVPPRSWERANQQQQHKAGVTAPGAAPQPMAEQPATHPKARRRWFFTESIGVERAREAVVAPARLAPATSSEPERVELAELAELTEITDDEAMHRIVVRHLMPAQGVIGFDRQQGRYLVD